jgi:hypothetical protein
VHTTKSDAVEAEKMAILSSSDLITGLFKAVLLSIGKEKVLDAWGRRLWPKAWGNDPVDARNLRSLLRVFGVFCMGSVVAEIPIQN